MASFNSVGIDEAIKELQRMGKDIDRIAPMAAEAGARALLAEMEKTVPVRTGVLKGHLKMKGPHHTTMDGYYYDVFPDGTKKVGKKRQRLAEVGFVLEYGRSNMPARPWMRTAREQGSARIEQAMADVITKEG